MFKLGNKGMIKISCKKFPKDTNIFNKKIKYHKWCRLKKSRKKTRTQRVKHYSCLCIWSLKLSATTDKTRIQFQCSHWTKGIEYVPVSKGKKKKTTPEINVDFYPSPAHSTQRRYPKINLCPTEAREGKKSEEVTDKSRA